MTPLRYRQLDLEQAKLTEAEVKEGWHFCREWDQMLIGPGMEEISTCPCFRKQCPTCEE